MKYGEPPMVNEKINGKIKISPDYFDMILPELADKGTLDVRQVTEIQKVLREEGPDSAAVRLAEILKKPEADTEQKAKNFKLRIINAIKALDVDKFLGVIEALDIILTSHTRRSDSNQIYLQRNEAVEFFDELKMGDMKHGEFELYLSDGGISRIVIIVTNGEINIFPASPSSKIVKEKWEKVQ